MNIHGTSATSLSAHTMVDVGQNTYVANVARIILQPSDLLRPGYRHGASIPLINATVSG